MTDDTEEPQEEDTTTASTTDEESRQSPGAVRPDPSLHPARDPGIDPRISAGDVSRDGVASGAPDPASLTAADTEPVANATTAELVGTLSTEGPHARKRAALALAEREGIGDDARAALLATVRGDDDPTVRQFAVEALAAQETDDGAALTAIEEATDDENPWVRAEAVVALDGWACDSHGARFEDLLSDEHEAVRRNAAIALFRTRDAVDELLALLDDPSDRVREWAARLLGSYSDDDRVAAALARTARDDPVDIVRAAAGRALELEDAALRQAVEGRRGAGTREPSNVLNRQPDV